METTILDLAMLLQVVSKPQSTTSILATVSSTRTRMAGTERLASRLPARSADATEICLGKATAAEMKVPAAFFAC